MVRVEGGVPLVLLMVGALLPGLDDLASFPALVPKTCRD